MIVEQKLLDQPVKNSWRKYDNIWKTAIGQKDDCTATYLLD